VPAVGKRTTPGELGIGLGIVDPVLGLTHANDGDGHAVYPWGSRPRGPAPGTVMIPPIG
jgi:hypothetical protein